MGHHAQRPVRAKLGNGGFIATQFDTNYQVSRRLYDIVSNDPSHLNTLVATQTTAMTPENGLYVATSDVLQAVCNIPNTAGTSLALKQAMSEIYARDIRDVFMNFCIACSMFRNNTAIPAIYRHNFPFWVMWNTAYAGYTQILNGLIASGQSAQTQARSNLWTALNSNLAITTAQATNYVGQTFYDNFIRSAGLTSSSDAGGVVSLVIDTVATRFQVAGVSVGDTIVVSGFTGPAAAWNGTRVVSAVYNAANPAVIVNNVIQFTGGAPSITATNVGTVALFKYTRQMVDLSSLIYQIPPSVTSPTTNVSVSVTLNAPFTSSEIRVAMAQFTTDSTSLGSFNIIGPVTIANTGNSGATFNNFAATLTGTGPIRLIVGNVTTTDYSLLPGGQLLDNYFYPAGFSANVVITRS